MTSTEEWRIRRNRENCPRPGCPMSTVTEWYAVLELPSCERRDLCEACFQSLLKSSESRPIYWRVRRKDGDRKSVTLDLASLRVLFDRLGDVIDEADEVASEVPADRGAEPDPDLESPDAQAAVEADGEAKAAEPSSREAAAGLRFFVALLLVRKRQLRIIDPVGPEQEAADLVVIDPKASEDAEPVLLFQPELSEERLEGLKDELLGALAASDPA